MSKRSATFFLTLLVFLLMALTAWINWALQRIEEVKKRDHLPGPQRTGEISNKS